MSYQNYQIQKQIDQQEAVLVELATATVNNMFDISKLVNEKRNGL